MLFSLWRLYIGIMILLQLASLSRCIFGGKFSFGVAKELAKRFAFAIIWPLAVFSGKGITRFFNTYEGLTDV